MKEEVNKSISNSELKGKYIYFPYYPNQNLEFKIHKEFKQQAINIGGFSIVKCKDEYDLYISVEISTTKLLLLKSEIKKVLPTPIFLPGDEVNIISKGKSSSIKSIHWHHKDEQYYYLLENQSKRYYTNELEN